MGSNQMSSLAMSYSVVFGQNFGGQHAAFVFIPGIPSGPQSRPIM